MLTMTSRDAAMIMCVGVLVTSDLQAQTTPPQRDSTTSAIDTLGRRRDNDRGNDRSSALASASVRADDMLTACYVPLSGTIYRIGAPRTPTACLSSTHVPFSFPSSTVIGPVGEKGATGDAGAPGAKGDAGVKGDKGERGDKGDKGDQGLMGPPGPSGAQGATGASGAPGATGAKGDVGAAGPAGPTGRAGPIGPAGPAGPAGSDGAQGPAGPAGANGEPGAVGAAGPIGPQGTVGATGAAGPPGPQGPQGLQGPQGPQGADGMLTMEYVVGEDSCFDDSGACPTMSSSIEPKNPSYRRATATCPEGKLAVSGGYEFTGTIVDTDFRPFISMPESRTMPNRVWVVEAFSAKLGPQLRFRAHVLCASAK